MFDDVFTIYNNYLHLIDYYLEYGENYGDTLELIRLYEEKLINILGENNCFNNKLVRSRCKDRKKIIESKG